MNALPRRVGMVVIDMFLAVVLLHAQSNRSVGETPGKPWIGERGVVESVSDIMARAHEFDLLVPKQLREPREEPEVPPPNRVPNPNSPEVSQWPPNPVPAPAVQLMNPQTVGVNFLGAQSTESGYIPPDSQGDVGPTQILVCVNGRIKVFDKTGVLGPLNATTDAFFNSVRNGWGTSDPRVRYDRLTQRWFVTIINVDTPNRILIAVSSGPTITGTASFTFYQFQHDLVGTTPNSDTGGFADYNLIGLDVNALYIGQNVFNSAGTAVIGTTAFVVRKTSVLSGGPIVVTAFRQIGSAGGGSGIWTPQGVDNDDPTATEGYYIGTDNTSFGLLIIKRISNPGGTPSISGNLNVTVPSTSSPINVPHPGGTSSNVLDGLDDRLFAASIFKNKVTGTLSLWTAHNIQVNSSGVASSSGGRNGSRWYEITNLTTTPTLVQSGTLFDPAATTPLSYWIPSVAMSGQGHMAIGTSRANRTTSAGVTVAGRLTGDALGTTQSATLAQAGGGDYTSGTLPRRWGDYSLVRVDPNNNQTMWTFQEYVESASNWGVRVTQLRAPAPVTPATATPSTVAQGLPSVDVMISGTSASGTAFFDPGSDFGGPGFANHIAASVSGGVVVTSVTFVNPTTVTLSLNTVSASMGAQNVTVTNPDGQSATGNAILTISGSAPTVAVSAPNGGEDWPVGLSQGITWTSNGISGDVKIELSRNGGGSYEVLFAGTTNDGTEAWTVTSPATANALMRISSVSNPAVVDVSNGPFTISPSFALLMRLHLHDNGGEQDSLEWGTGEGATDGVDPLFGEIELPPVPPIGVLDVRWQIAGTEGTKRDIRDTLGGIRQQVIYTGKLQAGEGGYPFTVRWNRLDLPSGTFILRDGYGGSTFTVDMKQQDSLVISDDGINLFQIVYGLGSGVTGSVQGGWNMVSLPVTVADRRRVAVFPTSISGAFAYTPSGYANKDTLDYGAGYWLKFPATQVISVPGETLATDTIAVAQGWNMIGAISTSVPVGSIVQLPSGIVASQYFGYTGGMYNPATTIDPMKGYWVKVSQNGRLVLTGGAFVVKPNAGGRTK